MPEYQYSYWFRVNKNKAVPKGYQILTSLEQKYEFSNNSLLFCYKVNSWIQFEFFW